MTKRKLTKSALARKLLDRGYSITETAKTVGMLYGHAWAVHREMQLKGHPVRKIESAPEDDTVTQVLVERGNDYGDYASKAQFIQGVKYLMRTSPSWEAMDADMRESMEMIAHKMGRTLYGNPTHKDNFLDIAGYAKLVADRL
jgi:hypothetical protein